MRIRFGNLSVCCAVVLSATTWCHAQLLGPTPYVHQANSPFAGDLLGFLEDFEDNLLNTPGVSASAGAPLGPGGNADSVDGDDGLVNGNGTNGRSFFFNSGGTGISFTFDAIALGGLPTHAGIVWTDGLNPITFEAFDQSGASLGTLTGNHADASFNGGTAEDRFYGAIHAGGISRIHIKNAANAGIEVDHLQYGRVPEPGVMGLLMAAACALLARRRR